MKINIQGWNYKKPIYQENNLKITTKRNITKFDTKIKWKNGWGEIVKIQINQENNSKQNK